MLQDLCWRPRVCEIHWDDDCTGAATDPHEPLLRSRGGAIDDPSNVVLSCGHCHDQAHRHPEEAARRGWMRSRSASGDEPPRAAVSTIEIDGTGPDPF